MRSARIALVAWGVGLFAVVAARGQAGPQNLDFEAGAPDQTPPGWFVPTAGYTAVASAEQPQQGKFSARLASAEREGLTPFGNLMQVVDAAPYRGKLIRLRAAVRVVAASAQDRAQLWLRVDRPGGERGFFDNMGDRPISAPTWKHYEIVGPVAEDATSINFGLMLVRNGQAWLDDVSLQVLGAAPQEAVEGPRPLTGRGLDNLVAFTRLLGYVRHFHPSDEAAQANWGDFAIVGVRAVEDAADAPELARRLAELFRPLAPTVRVFPTSQRPPTPTELAWPAGTASPELTLWEHYGVQVDRMRRGIYRSARVRKTAPDGVIPEGVPAPADPRVADLGGGVSCLVPLALWVDEAGTLPRGAEGGAEQATLVTTVKTGQDRATRLAAVALAWNVLQHFYPYFEVVDCDWPAVLRETLARAAVDRDERVFLDTLRRMVAAMHDGHARVDHMSDSDYATLPLVWEWVENRVVVTFVGKAAGAALHRGEVVHKIEGREIGEVLADLEQLISAATPQWRRYRALQELARGQAGSAKVLEVAGPDGQVRTVKLTHVIPSEPLREGGPEKITEVRPDVFYVDLRLITDEDFKRALPQLEQARGIVFDLRGYPGRLSAIVISHLIGEPVTCAQWHVPQVTRPDREQMRYTFSNWSVTPAEPRLRAKAAFITDGRAISYAETYLGIIEHYKLADIVGEPTAGTNGNVNTFTLPAGYQVAWTGMRVLKHDGSQHHGIGIRLTVPVERTIAGIRAGRDELLDRAIEVVSP